MRTHRNPTSGPKRVRGKAAQVKPRRQKQKVHERFIYGDHSQYSRVVKLLKDINKKFRDVEVEIPLRRENPRNGIKLTSTTEDAVNTLEYIIRCIVSEPFQSLQDNKKMIARGLPNRKKFAFVRGDKMEYIKVIGQKGRRIRHIKTLFPRVKVYIPKPHQKDDVIAIYSEYERDLKEAEFVVRALLSDKAPPRVAGIHLRSIQAQKALYKKVIGPKGSIIKRLEQKHRM